VVARHFSVQHYHVLQLHHGLTDGPQALLQIGVVGHGGKVLEHHIEGSAVAGAAAQRHVEAIERSARHEADNAAARLLGDGYQLG
jgi:hypothetical protein